MGQKILSENFLGIKEKIASQFNKMPLEKRNESLFNSIIEKIDTD